MRVLFCLIVGAGLLFPLVNPSPLLAQDQKKKQADIPYLKKRYYELELGSSFSFSTNLNNERLGLELSASLIQDHILNFNIGYVLFLTGVEFRYNCLRNSIGENCLFMLAPVLSIREPNELVPWIEYQLDLSGGFAYSTINTNSDILADSGEGALGYISINPGISFLAGRVGIRASYFFDVFFFLDQTIWSHMGGFSIFSRF